MSVLLLVRHGQASFGSANYDKLSELGVEQSAVLGEHWVKRGFMPDGVFSGEQVRQKETLGAVSKAYRDAGKELPKYTIDGAFNEYDATSIMTMFLPRLLKDNKELQELVSQRSTDGVNSAEGRKAFQKAFAIVMDAWISGEADVNGVESWEEFTGRVVAGVKRIVNAYPEEKTVAVFTSGGAISATLQYALGLSGKMALELGWVVKNASINEFKFKGDKFTLTGFNKTPHFEDERFTTYR